MSVVKIIKEQPVRPKSKEMQSWQQKLQDYSHNLGKSLPVNQHSHNYSNSILPLGGFWLKTVNQKAQDMVR